MSYAQELKSRSTTKRVVANPPPVEDHMVIEAGGSLEDVRRASNCDLSVAKRSASRLPALLANKFPHETSSAPARGGLAPWQKRKVQNYVESGLEGPLLTEDLAKLVSLSSSHFWRAFKNSFGDSPHAYVIKMRVERARILMLTTSENLSQIALVCGLADQAHLCRRFRQATGTTPGAWRRRQGKAQSAGLLATVDQAASGSHQHPYSGAVAAMRRKVPGGHPTSTEVACLSA